MIVGAVAAGADSGVVGPLAQLINTRQAQSTHPTGRIEILRFIIAECSVLPCERTRFENKKKATRACSLNLTGCAGARI